MAKRGALPESGKDTVGTDVCRGQVCQEVQELRPCDEVSTLYTSRVGASVETDESSPQESPEVNEEQMFLR